MENSSGDLCRLCLKLSTEVVGLFSFLNGDQVAELIKKICPIVIEKGEHPSLPKKVCKECLELVIDALSLIDLSLTNDIELRENIEKDELLCKIEEVETDQSENYIEALDEAVLEADVEYSLVTPEAPPDKSSNDPLNSTTFCDLCCNKLANASSLKRHQLRKHQNVTYSCDLCCENFRTKHDIEMHMRKLHKKFPMAKFVDGGKNVNASLTDMYEKLDEPEGLGCTFCSYKDLDEESLNEHLLTHQDVVDTGKVYCIFCPSQILTMDFMIKHTQSHNKTVKTHRCLICSKTFAYDEMFLSHLKRHKKNQSKICWCPLCGKQFTKPRLMDDHVRFMHYKEALFCCPICGQGFGSKSALNGHVRRHQDGNKYRCPFCPKEFSARSLLNSHKVVHSTDRPFTCNICAKSFKLQKVLQDHLRRHEGINPIYVCDICNRKLNSSFALSRHSLIHKGLKPHQCEYCDKAYAQKNDLNKHRRMHVGENTYFCDFEGCSESFRIISDLRLHQGVHYVVTS